MADYSGDGTAAVAAADDDDKCSLGRAVEIVAAVWVGVPGDVGSMPHTGRYLSFLHTAKAGCASHTASCHTDTGVKRPRHEPYL